MKGALSFAFQRDLERKIIGTVCKILEYGGEAIFSNKHEIVEERMRF